MKYAQVRSNDIANGPGIRVTLFVTGCPFRCAGCFNEAYQDFGFGREWSKRTQEWYVSLGEPSYIDGYSILGGEPLAQGIEMIELLKTIKEKTGKSIWMWTGYRFEDLNELQHKILDFVDVLVDGGFVENHFQPRLQFMGSTNQRLIKIQETLRAGRVIEVDMTV